MSLWLRTEQELRSALAKSEAEVNRANTIAQQTEKSLSARNSDLAMQLQSRDQQIVRSAREYMFSRVTARDMMLCLRVV